MRTYFSNDFFQGQKTVTAWMNAIPNYSEKEHKHEFLEIAYTLSGTVIHMVDNVEYIATPGCMLFINQNQVHSITTTEDTKFINLILKPQFISQQANDKYTFYDIFRS